MCSLVNQRKLQLPQLAQILTLLGVEQSAFREFDTNNMRDMNEYLENHPLFKDNVYSINSSLQQRSQSPILRTTGLKLTELTSKPFFDNSSDGLYTPEECKLQVKQQNRHLLTFEADILNMVGVGNVPPAELQNFTTDFLISREHN